MSRDFSVIVPPPFSVVALLLLANVVVYVSTASAGLGSAIPNSTLLADGAIHLGAFAPGERWRLIAATFLHANPAHLFFNMVSLLVLGPTLERRGRRDQNTNLSMQAFTAR